MATDDKNEVRQMDPLIPVGVPSVVMTRLREEQKSRRDKGIPMSLGALIGEAVMERFGTASDEGC